jgi:hypothetical protein
MTLSLFSEHSKDCSPDEGTGAVGGAPLEAEPWAVPRDAAAAPAEGAAGRRSESGSRDAGETTGTREIMHRSPSAVRPFLFRLSILSVG